jgi:hypothetical protein
MAEPPAVKPLPTHLRAPSPTRDHGERSIAPTLASAEVVHPNVAPAPRADLAEWAGFDKPAVPRTIHQYELIRELGHGGMGVVWLARDTRLGRQVAVKLLQTTDPSWNARFMVEARTTARLQHENIVVIHEINTFEHELFMVLELLEGQSLGDLMEEGRLRPARALELIIPVVRALCTAHAAGVVHRDLKPDNVFVTHGGVVKVLDFGIVKLLGIGPALPEVPSRGLEAVREVYATMAEGRCVGTPPYMSPEQWGVGEVDHRSDLFAVGVMLFEMLTGRRPLPREEIDDFINAAIKLDEPLRSITQFMPEVPDGLARIVDRCLAKRPEARYQDAESLLADLEALAPRRLGRAFVEGDSPYLGLQAFQETDAGRFFGRERDIRQGIAMLEGRPLVAVVGPSGVGKSSYVRAGIMPALKGTGQLWESLVLRPGRNPVESLASLLLPLTTRVGAPANGSGQQHAALVQRLHEEPGLFGTTLRSRARQTGVRYLVFVDQFEELYTLVTDAAQRHTFTRCLSGAADDASSPLRVIISMRSDLLDRAVDDSAFIHDVTRGLLFLSPLDRSSLHEALVRPAELAGYRFESQRLVEQMLDAVADTPGALPLLQFAAARLWEQREPRTKQLTHSAHDAMGGVHGTLASHADQVLRGLAPSLVRSTRAIFQRLVTPERTRAIVDVEELLQLGPDANEINRLLHLLADARLIVLQSASDETGRLAELVHESLVTSWPTLRRWLDEAQEDSAFVGQLRGAAKQWEARGRAKGLLWRGEAADDALRFRRRTKDQAAPRELTRAESDYLDAVIALATQSARIRRGATLGAIALLSVLVAAAAVAIVRIRTAEQAATQQAIEASSEASRAHNAEVEAKEHLHAFRAEQSARVEAETKELEAIRVADLTREQLEEAFAKLRVQWLLLRQADEARVRAEHVAAAAGADVTVADKSANAEVSAAAADAVTVAQQQAQAAQQAAAMSRVDLEKALLVAERNLEDAKHAREQAEVERAKARQAERHAQDAAQAARDSEARIEQLLQRERARAEKLEQAKSKIATELR